MRGNAPTNQATKRTLENAKVDELNVQAVQFAKSSGFDVSKLITNVEEVTTDVERVSLSSCTIWTLKTSFSAFRNFERGRAKGAGARCA